MIHRVGVDLPHEVGMLDQRLHLRGEGEATLDPGEIERLDADAVPRKRQQPPALVPDPEGVIAFDPLKQAVEPPLLVAVDQHLGVTVIGTELVPAGDELGPELGVIVDFTVESDDDRAVLVAHRLRRGDVEVDDREAAVTEANSAVVRNPAVSAVRPAMRHGVAHAIQDGAIDPAGVAVR